MGHHGGMRGTLALLTLAGCGRLGFDATGDGARGDGVVPFDSIAGVSGLVGYWKFDDGSGTTAADASANGHALNAPNGIGWTTGASGGAVRANGVDQFLQSPILDLQSTTALTVSLWLRHTYVNSPTHAVIELSPDYSASQTGFALLADAKGECVSTAFLVALDGDVAENAQCFGQPSSDAWHHVVAVFDKSLAGCCETALYVDGSPKNALAIGLNADNANGFGPAPFYLFRRGATSVFLDADLDELAIFDRALTADEIAAL